MKLSIITISFNTQNVLKDCLNSLWSGYEKQFQTNVFEIIVVDNNSTDGSQEMITKNYPWVRLIKNNENVGFSKANNQGIQKSSGEFVLCLNPDALVPKNTLSYMVNFMEKNSNAGIATCRVLLKNGKLDDASHRGFPTPWRAFTHFIGFASLFPNSQFFNGYHLGYKSINEIHNIDACAGAFLLIRRKIGEEVEWYDEDYFWYGEDLDLCFKVKLKGYEIVFVPHVAITHLKGAASGIKKHSEHLATIDPLTKRKITKARFQVMRIFYKKHYINKYPGWLRQLVFLGIDCKEKITQVTTLL